ncbi:hypothetical protein BGX24_006339 [Mortierella sp. AD032]|nr:hypothetical protein BGX24_006339 [Mortierella sp. AD032]
MSRSKLHPTGTAAAATTTTIQAAAGVSALNDLLSDPYPTPSTSPSLAPTRKHQHQNPHFAPSPLSNTTTTTTTTSSPSPSASSYHTIAGAAAAHLIKQHQQQLQLQQQRQQQQQQAIHDNARTLPAKLRGSSTITTAAAALNLQPSPALPPPSPRKNGTSRIGQSILGQLLAAHSPGRNKSGNGNDNALSSETHRPKEQQRRSILPAGWGLFSSSSSKSRTIHGPSLTTTTTLKHSPSLVPASAATTGVTGAGVGGGPLLPSQLMENPEPTDRLQPVLPSVWLESILSGLPSSSRADLNNHTAPHYATLPRVNWQEDHQQQQQQGIFPGLGPRSKKDENNNRDRHPSGKSSRPPTSSTSTAPSPSLAPATLHPKAQTLHRKSSVCELALGDDARELFQQNRPKTLSSAVISSSIVPAKESLRRRRSTLLQRSLDSSVALSPSSTTSCITKPVSEPSTKHRASAGSVVTSNGSNDSGSTTPIQVPATVKTTRGRFTIESSSALPSPSPRTRTLSCTSGMALPATGESLISFSPTLSPSSTLAVGGSQQQQQEQQRMMLATTPRRMHTTPSIAMSPSSPTLSRSFPSSRSLHSAASSSSSFPPSPRLSPSSTDHVDNNMSDINSSSNTTSSPISIPRASFSSSSSSAAAAANGSSNGGRSSHQRSQSSTSSLSRFSQVIIPPPASAASLQFASFSSIGSPSRSSAPSESSWTTNNGNGHVHMRPSSVPEKRPTNSAGSNSGHGNNIRNLSIQIVEADRTGSRNSSRSSTRRVLHDYESEQTPVHPLDEHLATPASASASTTAARTHQTMNRGSSSLGSRVGSISGGSNGMFMAVPDRRASDNVHQQQYSEGGGFGYYDRTSPGSFRPRSLSATNLDSSFGGGYGKNGSSPSLHQQLSWADRTAMQREGSAHSRSFDVGPSFGTPPTSYLSPHTHNGSGTSTPTPESDIVMVKKSAKGRMFTVERQSTLPLPSSPTRSSRFIVVSSTEDMCLSSAGSGALTLSPPHHSLH